MGAEDDKRPESVLVVVYTVAADVLLLRRVSPEDFWQSVTGSLEWHETPAEAAIRELQEETGLAVSAVVSDAEPAPKISGTPVLVDQQKINCFPILPAWRERYAPEIQHNIEHIFTLELPTAVTIELNSDEHSEYCWVPAQEAVQKASSWTNQIAIDTYVSPKQGME